MGWKNISSGRRYYSSIRRLFFIGVITRRIIGIVVYLKACWRCDAADKRVKNPEERDYPKKFYGSSKIIEAGKITNILEYEFHNCYFIIDIIVTEYDGEMKAVLKHP